MSRILIKPEPFDLRVVSAMLQSGSLVVSWATGQPATTQIDWGTNPDAGNTTPVKTIDPSNPGFDPDGDNFAFEEFHRVAFPQTFVDTEHFFRVRSTDVKGVTLQSDVFSVFVASKFILQSEAGGAVLLDAVPISVPGHSIIQPVAAGSNPLLSTDPEGAASELVISVNNTPLTVPEKPTAAQRTSMETNFTLTVV